MFRTAVFVIVGGAPLGQAFWAGSIKGVLALISFSLRFGHHWCEGLFVKVSLRVGLMASQKMMDLQSCMAGLNMVTIKAVFSFVWVTCVWFG